MLLTVQRRLRTEIRKEQIIEAAQKIILKYGGEHVTIKRIAEAVGISEGAIYRHFKSKDVMFSFLLDSLGDSLLEEIGRSFVEKARPIDRLQWIFWNHISDVTGRKGLSFQIVAEVISLGDKKLNKQLNGIISNYIGNLKDLLAAGIEAGEIRPDIDLDAAAVLFFGVTESLSQCWAQNNSTGNAEQRIASAWDIFKKGIAGSELKPLRENEPGMTVTLNKSRNRPWRFFERALRNS